MLKAFILSYIGHSIDAGFWYYAAAFVLVVAELIAGVKKDD